MEHTDNTPEIGMHFQINTAEQAKSRAAGKLS
jgi:hypothetical protein